MGGEADGRGGEERGGREPAPANSCDRTSLSTCTPKHDLPNRARTLVNPMVVG